MKLKMQYVFKRYEKKYMLNIDQYNAVLKGIDAYMALDQYGKTTICNVYFDTVDDRLIRTSIEKPMYKEKFRIRSYGVPGKDGTVFLEIKKKFKGIVYKRRVMMTLEQAKHYVETGRFPDTLKGNIPREIDYMINLYDLKPKVFIAYDRTAYYERDGGPCRITFDSNIRSRYHNIDLDKGDHGKTLLPGGSYVMEVKITGGMPIWLCRLLSENKVYPASFSKYGKIYLERLKQKLNLEHKEAVCFTDSDHKQEDKKECLQVS